MTSSVVRYGRRRSALAKFSRKARAIDCRPQTSHRICPPARPDRPTGPYKSEPSAGARIAHKVAKGSGVVVRCPSLLAWNRVLSSNTPVKKNSPRWFYVVTSPACGPSSTSTRAPVNDRNAVSETVPLIEIVPGGSGALGGGGAFGVDGTAAFGEGDTGEVRVPSHPANATAAIAIRTRAGIVRMC